MRELDIRRALRSAARAIHADEPDTLFIDEMGLCEGTARVDFAVVNGEVHGFEIKSAQDTLARLPSQCGIYNRALNRVTLVIDTKHIIEARQIIPRWWGIWEPRNTNDGTVGFKEIRKAAQNPAVDGFAQVQLLWRQEALDELESRALAEGVRGKSRRIIWRRLADSLSASEIGEVVRTRLKDRESWRVQSQ